MTQCTPLADFFMPSCFYRHTYDYLYIYLFPSKL